MALSVGCDLVEVDRIQSAVSNPRFFNRVYTPAEQEYASGKGPQTLAGMWAAKEAVSKALGTGVVGFGLRDIEVGHDQQGRPVVCLHNGAADALERLGGSSVSLSIAHDCGLAMAFVVID